MIWFPLGVWQTTFCQFIYRFLPKTSQNDGRAWIQMKEGSRKGQDFQLPRKKKTVCKAKMLHRIWISAAERDHFACGRVLSIHSNLCTEAAVAVLAVFSEKHVPALRAEPSWHPATPPGWKGGAQWAREKCMTDLHEIGGCPEMQRSGKDIIAGEHRWYRDALTSKMWRSVWDTRSMSLSWMD